MNDFKEWLSDYLRYFLLGFAILAVLVIAIVGIAIYKKWAVPASKIPESDIVRVETEGGETDRTDSEGATEKKEETEKKTEKMTEETEHRNTEAMTERETKTETSSESDRQSESQTKSQEETETAGTEKNLEYLRVTTTLNLRSEPDGPVINSYGEGRIVKFLGREDDWYKVRVGGRDGYMSAQYLEVVDYEAGMEAEVETEPATEPPTEAEPIYKTLKGACYLRADTSKEAEILGTYSAGASIQFLEDVGGWYRVQVDGMVGYMGAQFF